MEEKNFVLITTVGDDRPGIVEEISAWIYENKGNIEDSRMSQLGGAFATIILTSGGKQLLESLNSTKAKFMKDHEWMVFTREVSPKTSAISGPSLRFKLNVSSLDHPGIVHDVSRLLHQFGINIVSAETRTVSSPFTGTPAFHLEMAIDIPAAVTIKKLRESLAELCDSRNIDTVLSAE